MTTELKVAITDIAAISSKLPLENGRLAVSLPAGTGALSDAELRAAPLDVNIVSGGAGGSSGGLTNTELRAAAVPVSGAFYPGTQPVSGTFWQATQPVSGTFWQAIQPVSGPVTDAQLRATALPVSGTFFQATQPVSGTFWQSVQPISAGSLPLPAGAATQATLATLATDAGLSSVYARLGDGSQHTIVDSLPVGLATSALQGTGNTSLASLDTKTTLGQALMAASRPVVIASNQSAIPVSGTFYQATQPVSGPLTDTQLRATALPVSGTFYQATQPVSGTFWQATQPVSAAALPLPTGAASETTLGLVATQATLALIKAKTDNLDVLLSSRAITGLTDAQLRAAAVPISAAALPLPTGAAADTTVSAMSAKLPATLGQKTMAGSTSVALASDQSSIPVTGTFYQATQPVSGTFWQATQPVSAASLPLPAGASTEATLALIKAKTDNLDVLLSTRGVTGLTDAQLRATAVAVSGAFFQATQPVSIAASVAVTGPLTDAQLRAAAVPVSAPVITKGVQGANGLTTQDLKDAGRVLKTYNVTGLACSTSEALISLTPYADLVASGAATTFAVTAGKRLRIQSITVTSRATSTVNVGGVVRLRLLAGTVLVGSPCHASLGCMSSNLATAVIGNAMTYNVVIPDGLELSGTMQFGLTQIFSATTATIDVQVTGYEY